MARWRIIAVLVLLLSVMGCAQAAELTVEHLKENTYSSSFDGVTHRFVLVLPEECEGAPLVVMLPGYGNTAESFRTTVHFEQDAGPRGYAVVYVTGARDPNNSISSVGWNSGIGAEGNDDVGFLTALTAWLQKEYGLDDRRTFAVGFSNGAFMVHRLAMEAGDTFSACVSVAGMMPAKIWQARNEVNAVSFFEIYGEKDDVVPKNSDGSAAYAKDPAIEEVMSYWAASNGLDRCETEEIGNGSVLTKCGGSQTAHQVWDLVIKNGRHSWPAPELNRIDANALILEFFQTIMTDRP